MLLFIRWVDEALEITEELAKDIVTDNDIYVKVKKTIFALGLNFKIVKGGTTDWGRNVCGTQKGLVGNVCKIFIQKSTYLWQKKTRCANTLADFFMVIETIFSSRYDSTPKRIEFKALLMTSNSQLFIN